MDGVLQKAMHLLTKRQLDFIAAELKVNRETLLQAEEEQLDEIYDILCDIEAEETPLGDEPLSERCKIVSDIVTILGNEIAKDEGLLDQE